MKTTASKPEIDNNSSSESCHALPTQPGEGKKPSKLKWRFCLDFSSATQRGSYTTTLPGCFLRIEYNVKYRRQRPRLIPTEVKRAERIIPPKDFGFPLLSIPQSPQFNYYWKSNLRVSEIDNLEQKAGQIFEVSVPKKKKNKNHVYIYECFFFLVEQTRKGKKMCRHTHKLLFHKGNIIQPFSLHTKHSQQLSIFSDGQSIWVIMIKINTTKLTMNTKK